MKTKASDLMDDDMSLPERLRRWSILLEVRAVGNDVLTNKELNMLANDALQAAMELDKT